MGIGDVRAMTLGEYVAVLKVWNKAHGKSEISPPSDDEFDQAVARARGD